MMIFDTDMFIWVQRGNTKAALQYMLKEYTSAAEIRSGNAIIAATAVENNMTLSSGNTKHYRIINELQYKP